MKRTIINTINGGNNQINIGNTIRNSEITQTVGSKDYLERFRIPEEHFYDTLFEFSADLRHGVPEYRIFVCSRTVWFELQFTIARKGDMLAPDGIEVVVLNPFDDETNPVINLLPERTFEKDLTTYTEVAKNNKWKIYKVPDEKCREFKRRVEH